VVLSGCNLGLNLGNSIWHSGTMAAAKQAALLGLCGVALSAPASETSEPDFEVLKPWIRRVLQALFAESGLRLVNVNFPRSPRGMVLTRAAVRQYDGKIVPTKHPSGRDMFWFTVTPIESSDVGTDRWAVEQGWISLTPLRLDLTDENRLVQALRETPLDEARAAATAEPATPEAAEKVREDEAPTAIAETGTEGGAERTR
jgi:5'-nucleotidase